MTGSGSVAFGRESGTSKEAAMKVKVSRWKYERRFLMLDLHAFWIVRKVPGDVYERMCLRHGKEHWLYNPSHHGRYCPSSGKYPGIECRCDECHAYQECWPDWRELAAEQG